MNQITNKVSNSSAGSQTDSIGTPKLGGPWTLVNCKDGSIVTNNHLRGRYSLIILVLLFVLIYVRKN